MAARAASRGSSLRQTGEAAGSREAHGRRVGAGRAGCHGLGDGMGCPTGAPHAAVRGLCPPGGTMGWVPWLPPPEHACPAEPWGAVSCARLGTALTALHGA